MVRYQIAWISLDEQFSWPGLRNQVGDDARIGARDEKRDRLLTASQRLEHLTLAGINRSLELRDAPENSLQSLVTVHGLAPSPIPAIVGFRRFAAPNEPLSRMNWI